MEDIRYNEFLEKLEKCNKHYVSGKFVIIGKIDKGKIITKNKYGECLSSIYDLMGGYNISIETAINKTDYFLKLLKEKNPNIFEKVEMVSDYINSITKITWKTTFGLIHIVPSDILTIKNIRISSAVDKKDYFLAELRGKREDFDNIDYSRLVFKNYNEKGVFRCKLHNINYEQALSSHKRGYQGCIKCAKNITFYCDETIDYFKESYGKFYIVRLYNEEESFYKVGITGSKNNRRKKDLERIYSAETIYEKEGTLKDSYIIEKFFLTTFKDYKYNPKIPFKGKGECFNINPFILYNNIEGYEYQDKIQRDKLMCEENGINYEQQLNTY